MLNSILPLENSLEELRLESLPRFCVLTGPAGIGKTSFCLENFIRLLPESKNPLEPDLLYLLPTAEHRERIIDLLLRKVKSGIFGEKVTTLSRLMRDLLKAGDFSLATDVERRSLLNSIVKEKGGPYFSSVREFPGFVEAMGDFVGELKESMVSLEDFRKGVKRLKGLRPELEEKYGGLQEILEAYEARLETLGLKDHRDGLFLLKETGPQKLQAVKFRHLFVDGFFDFSKLQLGFLDWLSRHSERITLTLTLERSEERKGVFEIPLETLKALEGLGFQTVSLSGKTNHRTSSLTLRHLAEGLFRPPHPSLSPLGGEGGGEEGAALNDILVLEATGLQGEAEMIAREIRRLVRAKKLYFSDIAVILRRVGDYEGILRSVFRKFRIPVEIHERERLRDAPIARTLASFFKILLEDWRHGDLFNFLKSSYVEKNYAEVCALELDSFDLGIASGRERWLKEMTSPLFEKIAGFHERFHAENSVEGHIRLTREVIQAFGLSRIPEVHEENSRRDFASLKRLESLFEEIRRANFSGVVSGRSFESFAEELLRLIEVDLFSLHERDKNRVQVYDISLARQKEYKVVFLAGLLEKYFPAEIREDPVLSDEERRAIELQERLRRQSLERYFFYLGITRARENVILSYPRFNLEGHEALPSFYVDEVQRILGGAVSKRSYPVSQSLPLLEDAVEEREVEAHVIHRLFKRGWAGERKTRALTLTLYNRFLPRPSFQKTLSKILFEPVAEIRDQAVRSAFLPREGIFKPTGLEIYGRCPYRYFLSQVLRLEEQEQGISAMNVGSILHEVLELYWKERVEMGKKELGETGPAQKFVTETLETLLKKSPLSGDKHYRIEIKKAQMRDWVCQMVAREIEEGGPLPAFRPRYFEFEFKKPNLLELYDPHRENILLRGKIDRIDVDPSGKYALVTDYKTGSSFKRKDLDWGRSLQLPLYLLAVQKILKLKPLGGQISQIRTAETSGFYSKEAAEELKIKVSPRSALPQKEFEKILSRAVRFSFLYAQGITEALIPVRPRDCDDYCPFPSVCRIEKWRKEFIYQEIREEDKKNGIV